MVVGCGDNKVLDRRPRDMRYAAGRGELFLHQFEEAREFVVLTPLKAVVVDAVLVGPNAGEDGAPAWTTDGVIFAVAVAEDEASAGVGAVFLEGVKRRCFGDHDGVEATAIDADVEDLLGFRSGLRCIGLGRLVGNRRGGAGQ